MPKERISKYFSPGTPAKQMEDTIVKALGCTGNGSGAGQGTVTIKAFHRGATMPFCG